MSMTNAELAILSLVIEQPRHGYEIEQVIEARNMRAWTEIGFSSIYYLLKKLEKKGLIASKVGEQQGRGPAPKVYHVTEAGSAAWKETTLEALSTAQANNYSAFLLGLSNLPGIPRAEVLAALHQYREGLQARLDEMLAGAEAQSPLPYFVAAMFTYSQVLMEAELKWLDEFIKEVEREHE